MIRAAIVEDEPLAARFLRDLLEGTGRVEVVGTVPDARAGLLLCGWEAPDAAFLDIRMPGPDGVQLAADLAMLPNPPLIVFTTGFADRAPDAFDLGAVHYLLKPLAKRRVSEAVDRIEEHIARRAKDPAKRAPCPDPSEPMANAVLDERLCIRNGGDDVVRLLPLDQIVAAVCHGRRTWIHTARDESATYYSLGWLQRHGLSEPSFLKVSRDAIVNLQAIDEVIHSGDREYSVRLRDRQRTRVEASRSCAKRLADLIRPL